MRNTRRVEFYLKKETFERAVKYAHELRLNVNELAKSVFLQELIQYYLKGVKHGSDRRSTGNDEGHPEQEVCR